MGVEQVGLEAAPQHSRTQPELSQTCEWLWRSSQMCGAERAGLTRQELYVPCDCAFVNMLPGGLSTESDAEQHGSEMRSHVNRSLCANL